jgi:hypothetical protein
MGYLGIPDTVGFAFDENAASIPTPMLLPITAVFRLNSPTEIHPPVIVSDSINMIANHIGRRQFSCHEVIGDPVIHPWPTGRPASYYSDARISLPF